MNVLARFLADLIGFTFSYTFIFSMMWGFSLSVMGFFQNHDENKLLAMGFLVLTAAIGSLITVIATRIFIK